MYAVAERDGKIPPRVSAVKSLASALCIGTGGSVGREGPIVQIGAALGSTLAQLARVADSRRPILVACGAAGGIAATFNAPIAGVIFALEVILASFTAEAFGVVVLAAVTASVIGRAAFGTAPFIALPAFHLRSGLDYPLFALLGLGCGLVGVLFTRLLYLIEDLCDWAWHGPEWLRPAVGGLLLGGVLLALPQMYGVGYPVLENAVRGQYALAFLLLLIAGKIVAHQPHHRHRRLRRRVRTVAVHRRRDRRRLRRPRPRPRTPPRRTRRRLRPRRHGRRVRRRRPRPHHRRAHPVRAHWRIHDHPPADDRRRPGHPHQPAGHPRHDLHAEALPPRRRPARLRADPPASDPLRGRRPRTAAGDSPGDGLAHHGRRPCSLAPRTAPCPSTDADGHYQGIVTARAVAAALDGEPAASGGARRTVAADLAVRPATVTRPRLSRPPCTPSPPPTPPASPSSTTAGTHVLGWITHQSVLAALHPPTPTAPDERTLPGQCPDAETPALISRSDRR